MKGKAKPLSLGLMVLVCFLFGGIFAHADNIYVSNPTNGIIEVFNSAGQGSVFASTGLAGPVGLAFNGGLLYAACYSNNTIEVFNSAGHGSVFASTGLSKPTGLAFDKNGNLYVGNQGNNTIEKFNSSGQGTLFASNGVSGPVGLAFDKNGNLFVANALNSTIVEINPSGLVSPFASAASGANDPQGLAFGKSGNLYVSNAGVDPPFADGIAEFTPSRAMINFQFGLTQPEGLAFDSSDNLYVADYGAGTIEKIGSNGLRLTFASSGLFGPAGIAIQVPEPATWVMVVLAVTMLFRRRVREIHSGTQRPCRQLASKR